MASSAGALMIAGSGLFLAGAAIAVPRVFTEPDREQKRLMLEARPLAWRVGQPFYALGAIAAALGVGAMAIDADGGARAWLGLSACLLVLGALAWSWSVYLRAVNPRDFALGALPGWPFAAYVWLTLTGLVALGVGILTGGSSARVGWLTIGADAAFVILYVRYRDIPPFVFYLLLAVVGIAVL